MTTDLYRKVTARLQEAGCVFLRQGKGSHEIWFSPITNRSFSIPSNLKPVPLAKAILKAAGVEER